MTLKLKRPPEKPRSLSPSTSLGFKPKPYILLKPKIPNHEPHPPDCPGLYWSHHRWRRWPERLLPAESPGQCRADDQDTPLEAFGCTEAIIDDDCGLKRFYEVANILSDDLQIRFTNKEDDFDTIDWDFHYHGSDLTLHYNIYTGVSIYPTHTKNARKNENKVVVELATVIEGKLILMDMNRFIAWKL